MRYPRRRIALLFPKENSAAATVITPASLLWITWKTILGGIDNRATRQNRKVLS
jgi:hypothetical protein